MCPTLSNLTYDRLQREVSGGQKTHQRAEKSHQKAGKVYREAVLKIG